MWGFHCVNTGTSETFEDMPPLGGPPREPYVTRSEAVFATKEEAEEAARRHIAADPLHDASSEIRLLHPVKDKIIEGSSEEPVGKKKVEAFEPEPAKKAAKKRKKTTKKKRKKTTKKKGSIK